MDDFDGRSKTHDGGGDELSADGTLSYGETPLRELQGRRLRLTGVFDHKREVLVGEPSLQQSNDVDYKTNITSVFFTCKSLATVGVWMSCHHRDADIH